MSERPTVESASSGGVLELLVGGGRGKPAQLLLIEHPRADGQVHVRKWTSADWSAPPASRDCSAAGLLSEIERAARDGRGLNRELTVVRRWLLGSQEGTAR